MEEENQKAHEEEKILGEADNSAMEPRIPEDEEEIGEASAEPENPLHFTEKSSTDLSNPITDDSNHLILKKEEEPDVESSNNTRNATTPEVAEPNVSSVNKSEGKIHQVPEHSVAETNDTEEVMRMLDDHTEFAGGSDTLKLNSQGIHEGMKSSSDPKNEDTGDSSSHSLLDSGYIFNESLPVSADVDEPELFQDEVPESKNENQRPILSPKNRMLQSTSWKGCCGLLELLRNSDP